MPDHGHINKIQRPLQVSKEVNTLEAVTPRGHVADLLYLPVPN